MISGLQIVWLLRFVFFCGVEKFLQAISVNERSKSDGSDKVPLRRTTQKFDSSWIFLLHGD